jgi:plasmid maintenance system killer protein
MIKGFKHAGDREGTWAVKVSGNWRLTFVFSTSSAQL